MIDYVIVRSQDRRDVTITKAMTSADDCWTDHRLIRSSMSIKPNLKRRKMKKHIRRKINTELLQSPEVLANLQQSLRQSLQSVSSDGVKENWEELKLAIIQSCEENIGYKTKKHQDWFDENDHILQALIDKKRNAFCAWQNDIANVSKKCAHQEAKAEVQGLTREVKNKWWTDKAREIQHLADTHNTRGFFSATKAIYGPSTKGPRPIRGRDGTLLKDGRNINLRWREHFQELLNRHTSVDESIFRELPQYPVREDLSLPPSLNEVKAAIKRMKNHKAGGVDGIPAEVYKLGGPDLTERLHQLITKIWEREDIPADFRYAIIVTIFKKGDRADCGNYQGISLLSIAGKIIARILASRLLSLSEEVLPESQCGFRPNRGTMDLIFTARQLQEKCREQHQPLYMAFIDLTKAVDSVNRQALWKIIAKYGCAMKFINILRLLYDGMSATVLTDGSETEAFEVEIGVKQGCVIAPTLFSIFIATIIHLVKNKFPSGVDIIYRSDGKLFNLSRLRSKRKTTPASIVELQYADDNSLSALSEEGLQTILDVFAVAYGRIGLSLNIKKTQILHQPMPGQAPTVPNIQINGQALTNVAHFPYLGSYLSIRADIDAEIQHRLQSASAAFGRLRKRVFDDHDIQINTKILVYKAIVLPTLLYGSETWTPYRRHLKILEKYHLRCLRRFLCISWEDRCTNTSILEATKCTSIEAMLIRNQLRWAGHVLRMPEYRLPKQVLFSQLKEGTRTKGGQKKHFKDNLKANLKKCNINDNNWETLTQDRVSWKRILHEGATHFEDTRRQEDQRKRTQRKERDKTRDQGPTLPCSNICQICGKCCGSRIGLFSHMRTHRTQ